ncbi:MAG TPA: sigma-70 family RNA polymerase sigma factor [Verrucomicrobiae bacterium]
MPELNDHELLADFARSESEAAFAGLVARHVNLVFSAALRFTGNPHHAQEITQAVFIILARKAGKLSPNVVLSGWLYQTARLTAANFVKGEIRRQQREQEAYMQSTLNETGLPSGDETEAWAQITPLLDDAMGRLGETDRNAVVLRFFENKTAAEVAATLKTSEAAAHKRVSRALEKLRKIFSKRGVTLPAALVAGAVAANSVQAAPAGLAATISLTAVKGAAVTATVTTLVKGTLKIMTYAKLKLALGITAGILLAGGAVTVAISQTGGDKLPPNEILQKSQAAYAALTSYSDDGTCVSVLNGTTITHTFSIKLGRPDFYRVEWQQSSASAGYTSTGEKEIIWSAGKGDFLEMLGKARKEASKESAFATAAGISGRASVTIPGTFFSVNSVNDLGGSTASAIQKADAKVGEVDCYVFTSELKGRTKTVWIGKQDFLIHQVRIVTSAEAMKAVMAEAAKRNPEIVARMPKIEYTDSTATETHEHIVLNQKFSPADFAQ